ncbi:MAG: hypothetical protein CVU39_26590 [Chloroflexi bacterium HGW-Chloroflexi-10]|nr:MAG: hypothetical protein CVU39_26590 [Chloroflexi bacterium HGW-Chloroflexi-10]
MSEPPNQLDSRGSEQLIDKGHVYIAGFRFHKVSNNKLFMSVMIFIAANYRWQRLAWKNMNLLLR